MPRPQVRRRSPGPGRWPKGRHADTGASPWRAGRRHARSGDSWGLLLVWLLLLHRKSGQEHDKMGHIAACRRSAIASGRVLGHAVGDYQEPPMERQPPAAGPAGDGISNERRFAELYAQLRQLAERQVRRNAGAPVSPTTLLHEAYLGMSERDAIFP